MPARAWPHRHIAPDLRRRSVIDLDFVTLEPRTTYRGLKHFRPDLVEALADLKPRFMRFPGGCITHGLGMDNMYHWDRTIGPVEHRPHNFNLWGYHQSFRIGYYEYLCLCETIGAKPLPVLPAGVSCQNTSQGPVPVAQEDMPAYIDEVLHLIEFCNGSTATEWGAKRAAMGHPEPFGLEYLGIGNEDLIDDVFKNRFQQIFDAVKAAYPDIVIVGTVGPAPSGQDYEEGWKYAREAGLPIVDEHSYQSSSWWFHNLDHYDHTDRKGPKVYLGEYGSWNTQLINGLSEAAFMGRMELNGDVVAMAPTPRCSPRMGTIAGIRTSSTSTTNAPTIPTAIGCSRCTPPPRPTPRGPSPSKARPRCAAPCRTP